MFLLILIVFFIAVFASTFTFHNVSINSRDSFRMNPVEVKFTFHNVSINSTVEEYKKKHKLNLHSTMFLLIPLLDTLQLNQNLYLHSTMFLLIPIDSISLSSIVFLFTFHNVSINSNTHVIKKDTVPYLHSTMFLLIPGK